MCLNISLCAHILYESFCISWNWATLSFPTLGKFSTLISSSIFLCPFSFVSSSGTPIIQMWVCFFLSQKSSETLLIILLFFFFLFCSTAETSTILCFRLLIYSSASVFLLLILFSVFFISVIVLFISVCTFFSSPLSLLAIPAQS